MFRVKLINWEGADFEYWKFVAGASRCCACLGEVPEFGVSYCTYCGGLLHYRCARPVRWDPVTGWTKPCPNCVEFD